MTELGFFYDWLIVDVVLHDDRVFDPLNVQICDPGPADHRRLGRARAAALGVHAPRPRDPRRARGPRLGAARAVGRPTRQRHARTPRRLHVRRPLRRAVADRAGAARRRRRPPDAALRRPRHVRRHPRRRQPRLEARPRAHRRRRPTSLLDTYDQERLPSARQAIEFSIELGKVICVPDPDEAAARDEAMAPLVGPEPTDAPPLPGIEAGRHRPRLTPRRLAVRARHRRRPALRRRARRRLATRHHRPEPLEPGPGDEPLVRRRSAAAS